MDNKIKIVILALLLIFSMFAPFYYFVGAEGTLTSELTYKTDVKTLIYPDGVKTSTASVLVSKYDSKDSDRYSANLDISYVDSSGYKAIRFSDMLNSKGAIGYVPVDVCEKLLGSPPYGMNDTRYYPEKVEINKVLYYQFKIPHFSTVDITDWASSIHGKRRLITYDSDHATISPSGAVTNGIIYLCIGDSNASDITDSGDDANDLRFYGTDSGGAVVELDYDHIASSMATYWKGYIELANIKHDANTEFYVYYDASTNANDYEDASGTYANGVAIYNFQGDGADSSGNSKNMTVYGSPTFSTSNGLVGQGVLIDAGTEYFSIGTEISQNNPWTVVVLYKSDATDGRIFANGTGTYCLQFTSGYAYAYANSFGSYVRWSRGSTFNSWNLYQVSQTANGNHFVYYYNATDGGDAYYASTNGNILNIKNIGKEATGYGCYNLYWIFSGSSKGLNWNKHLYYTVFNQSTYITFGTASSLPTFAITESPEANASYTTPSSLDINVTITNGTGITFEECNFSYYDGSWHTIKNRVVTGDADKKTWSSSKISWRWDSTNSFPSTNQNDIKVKCCVYDGTTWYTCAESSTFDISFNDPPDVVENFTEAGTKSGDITIDYTLSDGESEDCSIGVEFSIDGGANYNDCTMASGGDGNTSIDSSALGIAHTYVWDSATDIPLSSEANCVIIIRANDGTQWGSYDTTGIFAVDNTNAVPVTTINTDFSADKSGDVTINITVTDAESDNITITGQYTLDGGSNWVNMTFDALSDDVSDVAPNTFNVVWDSLTITGVADYNNSQLRFRSSDAYGTGAYDTTVVFTVANSNQAPSVPTLLWPDDWAVGVNDNTEFLISECTDLEADAFHYDFEWCTSSSFNSTGHYIQKHGEAGNYTAMDIDFLRATIYYWRARSQQTDNNSTQGWSLTGHFQTDFNSTGGGTTTNTTNNLYQTVSTFTQPYTVYDQEYVNYSNELMEVNGFMEWLQLELNYLHLKYRFGPIQMYRWVFYLVVLVAVFIFGGAFKRKFR